jgi:hypothetical protein
MTALWVIVAVVGGCVALSWLTAAPAARGVPVSVRLAEARRIVEQAQPPASARRRPREHPLHPARRQSGGHAPRSRVTRCDGQAAPRLRHSRGA